MKTELELTLWDDEETARKLSMLSPLEILFDHSKNSLTDEYYRLSDNLPVGARVKITFEVIE